MNNNDYKDFCKILREELIPAEGCTEPIAIAYAASIAAKQLGRTPETIVTKASGNIIKNVMGVYIPHCGKMRGVAASAAVGALGGDPGRKLEVLSDISETAIHSAEQMVRDGSSTAEAILGEEGLHIVVRVEAKGESALCEIRDTHTNIVRIEKNGEVIFSNEESVNPYDSYTDRSCLSVDKIIEFANTVRLDDVKDLIEKQITCNVAIAQEGLKGNWGNSIGKMLMHEGDHCRAYAAAASDARMAGCNLPVVIVSGSGNQGATASLPVITYARENGISHEKLIRALVLSDLVAVHLKTGIGRLSAYCGAVSAAAGSGSAMTWLDGGSNEQIAATIVNTIATVSGMICDGAKPSCAAKIAASLSAAQAAHQMAMHNQQFESGTGIVKETVEETISVVGQIASGGMCVTDRDILRIMTA